MGKNFTLSSLYLFGVAFVLGFPIYDSVVFALFFTLNLFCGSFVWKTVTNQSKVSLCESVGAGIALGTLLPAIINAFVRTLGIGGMSTAWIFPLLVLIYRFIYKRSLVGSVNSDDGEDRRTIGWLLVLPWYGILAWGFNVLPFCLIGLAGLILEVWAKNRGWLTNKSLDGYLILVGILGTAATAQVVVDNIRSAKSIWEQFYGVDTVIDESVSWGISKYGMSENVLDLGARTYQHVLTHSWAGDISAFLGETRFMASGVLGFLVGLVGIAFLLFALARRIGVSNRGAVFVVGVFYLQASMPEELMFVGPRMANSISILWFLLLVLYTIDLLVKEKFKHLLVSQLLVIPITMGKAHWGLLYVFCLFPTLMMSKSFNFLRSALVSMIAFVGFIATYVIVIGDAGSDHATTSGPLISIGVGLLPLLISFLILRLFPLLITLAPWRAGARGGAKSTYRIFVLSSIMLLPVIWLTDGGYLGYYFLHPILLMSAPFAGSAFDRLLMDRRFMKAEIIISIISILFGASTLLAYLYANYRFIDAGRDDLLSALIVDYPELITVTGFVCVLVALFLLDYFTFKNASGRRLISVARYGLVMSFGISLGVYLVQTQRSHLMKSFYGVPMIQTISTSQKSVGEWLKDNVPKNEVIATNYFCTNLLREEVSFERGETNCFGRNSLPWISAFSHRRMLIEAPLFVAGTVFTEDQYSRYRESIFFGSTLDPASLKSLLSRGVQWFVVDKSQTVMRNFDNVGDTKFSVGEFVVIRLNEGNH